MTSIRRGISAAKIARDFGESLASFMDGAHALVAELSRDESPASAVERCRETCAALWATTVISMDASALRAEELEVLSPLVFATLLPHWKRHCGANDCASVKLQEVAQKYLKEKQESQVNTAAGIVMRLFDELKVSESGRRRLSRRLSALFAHRMLGDIHRLNEIKIHFGIQLNLIAGLFAGLQLLHGGEVLMRLLRLC